MKKLTKHKAAFILTLISILVLFGGVGYFIFSISKLNNVENTLRLVGSIVLIVICLLLFVLSIRFLNKYKKLKLAIVIILMLIPYNFTYAKVMGEGAENGGTGNQDFGLGDLENYKGTNPESQTLQNATNNILGIIQAVGTVVSVGALIAIGIKYMLGSVEEKADYKQTLKPYIIGAFILFTGTTLPNLIYQFAQNI